MENFDNYKRTKFRVRSSDMREMWIVQDFFESTVTPPVFHNAKKNPSEINLSTLVNFSKNNTNKNFGCFDSFR